MSQLGAGETAGIAKKFRRLNRVAAASDTWLGAAGARFAAVQAAITPILPHTILAITLASIGTKWDAQAEKNQHPLIKTR